VHALHECVSIPENKDFCNFTGGFFAQQDCGRQCLKSRAFIDVTIEQRRADDD